ncbi:Ger(x)C family spore germination C-terminal domain-containing protein [Cohnella sp. REN36]|uniref:Ger(x)C family spore germination C-terminal domain-containing protein n=1 Tax=Cohnella sp. REN36 TaxID=2887347 RepID=UPI001D15317E|nr:Ger(x)C family spore germination C-terminal domain-containing protein [Cohnella sp. REN36]
MKITETFAKGAPRYRIRLSVKGGIIEMINGATEKEMRRIATSLIQDEVRKTFLQAAALDADIYQLNYHTYLHHYGKWKRMNKQDAAHVNQNSLASVDVEIKLLNSGMLRTFSLH